MIAAGPPSPSRAVADPPQGRPSRTAAVKHREPIADRRARERLLNTPILRAKGPMHTPTRLLAPALLSAAALALGLLAPVAASARGAAQDDRSAQRAEREQRQVIRAEERAARAAERRAGREQERAARRATREHERSATPAAAP